NGDSSISQTFKVPTDAPALWFWYQVHCPDQVTFDWATATLTDITANTTTTILTKTCTNNSTWQRAVIPVSSVAGHVVTLTLISHDDGVDANPTYTLFDDVVVGPNPPIIAYIGAFEAISVSLWSSVGSVSISSTAHTGTHSAQVGSTAAFNGDSS